MTKRLPGHENNPPRTRTNRPAIKAVATIREIPDDLWQEIKPLLPVPQKRHPVGRKRVPYRMVLNGILYVLRTGCQWKAVPKEYGSGSTCHKRFQEWVQAGVFRHLWQKLLEKYDDLKGIDWEWQIVDTATGPAPLGGEFTGPSPVDRSKLGTKRSIIADGNGIPLGRKSFFFAAFAVGSLSVRGQLR